MRTSCYHLQARRPRSPAAAAVPIALAVLAAAMATSAYATTAPTAIWTNGSGNNLWDTTSANWNTANNLYANGDTAQFDDTAGPSNSNVTIAPQTPPLNPASVIVDSTTNNYVFSGGGYIAGSGSLLKEGSSTLTIGNSVANTYSGGTTINDGTLLADDAGTPFTTGGGSSTGTGPVLVNGGATSGTLGGDGIVGGNTSIQSGATLAPGSGNAGDLLTFSDSGSNALVLSTGADLSYSLNAPNQTGGTNGNDMADVTGQLVINPQISLSVTPGANFNTGTYQLINYGTLQDNSNNFSGWNASLTSIPTNLPASTYYVFGFSNHFTSNNSGQNTINLDVTTSTSAPSLTQGQSASLVQPANTPLDHSTPSNPAFTVPTGGAGGNSGPGGSGASGGNGVSISGTGPTQFFVARGPDDAANAPKMFNFGWAVAPAITPGEAYFNDGTVGASSVTYVLKAGGAAANPADYTLTNARPGKNWAYAGGSVPLFSVATGKLVMVNGTADTGTPFNAPQQNNPVIGAGAKLNAYPGVGGAPAQNPAAWLPVFVLSPVITVQDPPALDVPTYYGETFTNPNGDTGIYLADVVGNSLDLPTSLDQLSTGADAQTDYSGSFLSLVQSVLGTGITALSQLTDSQWLLFDGSYGIDPSTDTAWTVSDAPNNQFEVIGIGTAAVITPEPGALAFMALCAGALLLRPRLRFRR
ncbi:MAG: autotransporter-associated beta strand repeat-containing protein [Phycisphaerae bacterium]